MLHYVLHSCIPSIRRRLKKHSTSYKWCVQKCCSHEAAHYDRSKQGVRSQQDSREEEATETITHKIGLFSFVPRHSLCHDSQEEADKEEERELTPDEVGRKIASQWTTDPDAAGSALESGSEEQEEELHEEEEDAVDDEMCIRDRGSPM